MILPVVILPQEKTRKRGDSEKEVSFPDPSVSLHTKGQRKKKGEDRGGKAFGAKPNKLKCFKE